MTKRAPRRRVEYARTEWRLVDLGFTDGPSNMAVDAAIFESVSQGTSPPTLRLYGWNPGCISIGKDQPWEIVDAERTAERGWDVVRRLTDGRAILHIDELTAGLYVPLKDERVAESLYESFESLIGGFIRGLKLMGLDPDRSKPYYSDRGPLGPACYDGPSEFQVTIGGRKIVCGSLLEDNSAIMLQCSIPLFGEINRIAESLRFDYRGQRWALAARIGYRAATIESLLGRKIDYEEAKVFVREGCEQALNVELIPEPLTEVEISRSETLRSERYANEGWTRGG